ncbi:hypothetical protein RAS_05460 [Rickettsia asiatica]|uniref:Polymerase beta nucleotidyltransferase domain-containing protein n=1 Tax=Rickettsia asiatica TaxID=238800 RepID=A0A510GGL8_9RICK|nr:nucleotidyltransferase domain-containing protein [Rickettsia asiatica]BBJ31437.1 hypothetical protein RAS_05460 [Rickettsia asiatica]
MELDKQDLLILRTILSKYPYKFYAYGSRVKGNYKKFSDLDFYIMDDINYEVLLEIREMLEESDISIHVDIKRWFIDMDEHFRSLIKNDFILFE